MSLASQLNLTFGVEMECVIQITRKQFRSYRADYEKQIATHPGRQRWETFSETEKEEKARERVHLALCRMLEGAGIPTNDPTDPQFNASYDVYEGNLDYTKWTVENDVSVKPYTDEQWDKVFAAETAAHEKEAKRFNRQVELGIDFDGLSDEEPAGKPEEEGEKDTEKTGDDDGEEGDDDEVMFFAAEIITRVLPYGPNGYAELTKALDTIKANVTLFINKTCGLNVHVGNQKKGFPTETVRKFTQLVTAFEHIIESVCEDSFLLGNDCRTFGKSPSESPHLSSWNMCENLLYLEQCENIAALAEALNPDMDRRFAYNFQNLLPDPNSDCEPKRTIEMRQHFGSVEPGDIITYAELTIGLLNYAHAASSAQVLVLCMQYSTDPAFTVLDLLKATGKSHVAPCYADKLTVRPRPELHVIMRGTIILETFLEHEFGRHRSTMGAIMTDAGMEDWRQRVREGNPSLSEPDKGDEKEESGEKVDRDV